MPRRFEKAQRHVSQMNFLAVVDRHKRKLRGGTMAKVDLCTGPRGQFTMSGNEVRVKMRFDDVLDRETLSLGLFQIQFHIALWIHNRCIAARSNQVRRMRQTTQIELPEVHKGPRNRLLAADYADYAHSGSA